jgi:hypothetical protein
MVFDDRSRVFPVVLRPEPTARLVGIDTGAPFTVVGVGNSSKVPLGAVVGNPKYKDVAGQPPTHPLAAPGEPNWSCPQPPEWSESGVTELEAIVPVALAFPGRTGFVGILRVHEPEDVMGLAPVTVIWLEVPTRPTLVTLPPPLPPKDPHVFVDVHPLNTVPVELNSSCPALHVPGSELWTGALKSTAEKSSKPPPLSVFAALI